MTVQNLVVTLLVSATWVTSGALAHEPSAPAKPTAAASVPLYNGLGDLTYPITTQSELAQRYFDQGLRLTYAFNHAEARRAFREAQRLDPDCAMRYWGEAFVLGPNINAPMDEAAGNPAVTAISKAKALAHHANAREQALINALAARYAQGTHTERATLNQAYATAMAVAAQRFPDDDERLVGGTGCPVQPPALF